MNAKLCVNPCSKIGAETFKRVGQEANALARTIASIGGGFFLLFPSVLPLLAAACRSFLSQLRCGARVWPPLGISLPQIRPWTPPLPVTSGVKTARRFLALL